MKIVRAMLLAGIPVLSFVAPALAATPCDQLAKLKLPDTRIDLAVAVPAGDYSFDVKRSGTQPQNLKNLPAFCRVAATLTPSSDSDIKVEFWLPEKWNGKLQAEGNGNWGGAIGYMGMAKALRAGYAATSTDTGHAAPSTDGSFVLGHPEKVIDHGWRSEHEMTVKAKAVAAAFYGTPVKYAYWNGCSTGGRQAFMEATRFPDDYDGIIAGDAANLRSFRNSWQLATTVAIHKDPAGVLPPDKLPMIHKAVLDACDALDGVKDGLVSNPPACKFDPAVLTCKGADGADCLTTAQVKSVNVLYSPGKLSNGETYHPGLERGSELGWVALAGPEPDPLAAENFKYFVYRDAKWDWRTFNPDTGVSLAREADHGTIDATSHDWNKFTAHKGKLIIYHGWADPRVSPREVLNYYDQMVKETPAGAASTRIFMIPGMGHCRGGEGATDTFDMIPALDAWVANGKPPAQVIATHVAKGVVTRSRPLCPYPQIASYKGSGSIDEAANFTCKAP